MSSAKTLRARLAGDAGIVLPAVMGTLLVVSLIAAWLAAGALQSSDASNRDRSAKRALAAAEAGLQVAMQRLNERGVIASDVCVIGAGSGRECPTPATGDLGGGARFKSYVSQEINGTTVTCGRRPGYTPTGIERCVTAVGAVNGVQRRLQVRVSRPASPPPIWGTAGVIGKDSLYFDNSNKAVHTPVGSNGTITLVNSNEISGQALLGPGATVSGSMSQLKATPPTAAVPEWNLPAPTFFPYNNLALSTSYYTETTAGQPNRRFTMGNSAEYTMPAGDYNFCEMVFGNSVKLRLTGQVRIFIDANRRAGSNCMGENGSYGQPGRLIIENSVEVNKDGNAANLQIYVYGTGDQAANSSYTCPSPEFTTKSDVVVCNSAQIYGTIYAPDSRVSVANSVLINGAVAGKDVEFQNSTTLYWPDSVKTIPGFSGTRSNRVAWVECRPVAPTASDPESGC